VAKIVAYLSHSYHPEDRAINMAIWRKLNARGVVFAVDPPSLDRPMDVTFLERMMQRSHGFVAIVPDRSRALDSTPVTRTWSPYQEFECRLAIRANKPRLIVVEKGIELGPLSEGQVVRWFTRSPFELDPSLDSEIEEFVNAARPRDHEPGVLPKMGILRWTPSEPRWERLSGALLRGVGRDLAEFIDIDDDTSDHELLNEARKRTMVVADIHPAITPPHVLGLLHGAAIPIFRTCLLDDDLREETRERELRLSVSSADALEVATAPGLPASGVHIPLLFRGYRVDPGMRPIQFWKESAVPDAVTTITQIAKEYRDRERRLETEDNADDYFLKLRGNRVFISVASELSAWTIPLKEALESAGMPAFHYKVPEIPVGDAWLPALKKAIGESDLFLAFLSPGYWTSPVCMDEMAVALDRWERHHLVITVGTPAARPPMPAFLGRYQTERLSEGDRDMPTIVKHVQDRFRRVGRSDAMSVDLIARTLTRHLDAEGISDVANFLDRECGLPSADARDIAARTGVDATKIVESLVKRARVEKAGGSALGRLCFWLRRRESDSDTRRALTEQFSALRLFPKLHDVYAWNRRQTRHEVGATIGAGAPRQTLDTLTALAGDRADAVDAVRRVGGELAAYLEVSDGGAVRNEMYRLSVLSSFDDLMIPVEWAVPAGATSPVARLYPVYRSVSVGGPRRESLEDLFEAGSAAPPRVLLFGYAPPELPHVRTEIAELRDAFMRRYEQKEWPAGLVESLTGEAATFDALELALSGSDFDVLHIAGHAGWTNDGPVIQVAPAENRRAVVASRDLGQWLQHSCVRFAYLSCCNGPSMPLSGAQFGGWRQTLCREVIEAGVAEVAAYFWPVSDQRSARFASSFYAAFLQEFDAPGAMLEARRAAIADDPVWAGSLMVKAPRSRAQG